MENRENREEERESNLPAGEWKDSAELVAWGRVVRQIMMDISKNQLYFHLYMYSVQYYVYDMASEWQLVTTRPLISLDRSLFGKIYELHR